MKGDLLHYQIGFDLLAHFVLIVGWYVFVFMRLVIVNLEHRLDLGLNQLRLNIQKHTFACQLTAFLTSIGA